MIPEGAEKLVTLVEEKMAGAQTRSFALHQLCSVSLPLSFRLSVVSLSLSLSLSLSPSLTLSFSYYASLFLSPFLPSSARASLLCSSQRLLLSDWFEEQRRAEFSGTTFEIQAYDAILSSVKGLLW